MRYGSVCSGIEAASVAWHPLGWRAAFLSEIEPFPRAVLTHHYPSVPLHGDFTTIRAGQYESIELLVGGTPCQSFSVAGLRGGLGDDRGNLALQFLKLAHRLRPRWVVWENVPGVLSSNGGRDFGAILGGLGELGYGWAYRVLDAQYFGVPQRRRRVFVVGCLGDWRRAVAVLFERHSLSGHPAPRREAGQGVAPTIASRPTGGGGLGTDFDRDGGLDESTVYPIQNPTMIDKAQGGVGVGVANSPMYTLESRLQHGIAHSLRADGFDASEDGTGRGTPLVPVVAPTLSSSGAGTARTGNARTEADMLIAFDTTQMTSQANAAGAHPPAVAFHENQRAELTVSDTAGSLKVGGGKPGQGYPAVQHGMAVRRLTPEECEALQGFPRGYTLIPYRGKPAADGPRYKALGNSMAVPCMSWIGERVALVDAIPRSTDAAA